MNKKATLLASALCLIAVVSCAAPTTSTSLENGETSSVTNISDSTKYHLSVISTALPVSPNFPKEGDYEAGHIFEFKVEIVTDISFIPYLNDEPLKSIKEDSKEGYTYYSFTMPECDSTLRLSDDPYYLDKSYYLMDIYYWAKEMTQFTLKKVEIEDGYLGVNPETATPTVRTSERTEDIVYNINVLKIEPIVKAKGEMLPEGGWYKKVTYFLTDGSQHELVIKNGYITTGDFSTNAMFKFESEQPHYPDIIMG
ncbi:MAG: hypothetical protein MJ238_05205 [Bacilli bacterium]|nr:hypothetical protein [Bacilli bacterium]